MEKLRTRIQTYDWGSHSAIASLRGLPPSAEPQAELWAGAHPLAPSQIFRDGQWKNLDALIASDPDAELGQDVTERFGARLPFLVKILAADKPLSLQTHPDPDAARKGFLRESASGMALNDPKRTYKDDSAKPEVLIALTPFEGLCGFRPIAETLHFLTTLNVAPLDDIVAALAAQPDAAGLRSAIESLLHLHTDDRTSLLACVVAQATIYSGPEAGLADWLVRLYSLYPSDIGIAISLFLNYVVLQPGQALFLKAGNLHAYLSGMGVEVMANSDNVLRAGFTTKHIDIPELLTITDFTPLPDPIFTPKVDHARSGAIVTRFRPPVPDFRVERFDLDGTAPVVVHEQGPSIDLCTSGHVSGLAPTESAFSRPGTTTFTGSGTVWHVTANA